MRVDRGEVELAGVQEDHGADGGQAREAASAAFGGLEQTVDGFEKAVGLARGGPGHDAVQMATHQGGDLLHGCDLRAHHAAAPVGQHRAHHVDLLAAQDVAQLLLVDPGTRGAAHRAARDQGVQIGGGRARQIGTILQQRPTQALQGGVGMPLQATRPIDCRAGVRDDMELVERDAGRRQVLAHPLDFFLTMLVEFYKTE